MSRSKFIAVGGDVFAGAFTHGIKQAGFDVGIHLEHGNYGVKTVKLNYPDLDIRIGVDQWKPETIRNVDFLYTNPPCAPWSTLSAGRANTWDVDPRLDCVDTLMDAGLAMKVKAFAWESVTPAWGKGRSFVDKKAKLWMSRGYHVTILLQNNLYLGAPQNRRRMFFIAHLHPLVWPKIVTKHPTIGEVLKKVKPMKSEIKVMATGGDAILWERCKKFRNSFSDTYRSLPEGMKKKYVGGKPNWLAKRMEFDDICPVFFPGSVWHPEEPRRFTYREQLALCGLPLTWKCESDKLGPAAALLTRTVLSPVGTWLGNAVKDGLLKPKLRGEPIYRVVKIMSPTIEEEIL